MNSDESQQLPSENQGLAPRGDSLVQYNPNQNPYLRRFGFTSSLPLLMRDVNDALSQWQSEEPSAVELMLRPHVSAPQVSLETTYMYGQPVNLYFQGSTARLQIGSVPRNYAIRNYEKLSEHVAGFRRFNAELTGPEDFIRGGPHLAVATLEDLKDFVQGIAPDRKATLSNMGTYDIRRKYRTKSSWVTKHYPRSVKIEEDFARLTQARFNRLPDIFAHENRSPYEILVDGLREPFLLADIWSLRYHHENPEIYDILWWPVSFEDPKLRKFGRNVFNVNCIIYSTSSPTGGAEIENMLHAFAELKRKGNELLRFS